MNLRHVPFAFALTIGLVGCASIPPESVTLSGEVGSGIKTLHQGQISFLNLYFEEKREQLDQAMLNAVGAYFATITPSGSVTLTRDQLNDVAQDIIELGKKNTAAKESLEKVRLELVGRLDDNYLTLTQANGTITGLLQSAVAVKEASNKSIQLVSSTTGGRLQLDKVFSEIDSFVAKHGEEAGTAINLVEKVQELVK